MTYLDTWRTNLKIHLAEFALLAKEDRSINLIYGITAAAVLWGVRDAPFDDSQKTALQNACGDEKHLPYLVRAVGGWDTMTPLEAARSLSKRQRDSDELRDALTALMGTFIEELFEQKMVQHQHIDISGSVIGGNIVIGGYQIVAGDMVVQYITQQKIRACPTAPKPPAHFAGRRDELNRLKEVLEQGQSVAITGIQGVGGIGKTALSLQLASEMSDFSTVLWASLGPNPNTGNQLIEWARHADPDFDPGQDDIDMLANRVQALLTNLIQEQCPGRVLVILDDIWEGDSVRTARILQKAMPVNSVSLITTRSQLVVAQLRSTRLELEPMKPPDALQMLRNLLSDYPNIPDDTLLELAEVVGYHPLAMELAAGQVTLLERPVREISEQIEWYRGGIPAGSPFRDIGLELGEDREDNLELVLSFSYDSLTETEQTQFRTLGVLAYNSSFDHDLCKAIWDVDNPKVGLDSLRHRALLGIVEQEEWYQQHVLLRSYALALLKQFDEFDVTFHRYAQHTIIITERHQRMIINSKLFLGVDSPHIQFVGDELAQRVLSGDVDEKFLQLAGTFSLNAMNYLNHHMSMIFVESETGREPQRIEWLEMGLMIWQRTENLTHQAATLNNMGAIWYKLGNPRKALDYFEQALNIDRQLDDRSGEITSLINIGSIYSSFDDIDKAIDCFQNALSLNKQVGDELSEATILNNLGDAWRRLGNPQKAFDHFQQSMSILLRIPHMQFYSRALLNMGHCFQDLGEISMAHAHYKLALNLSRNLGDRSTEAAILNSIGIISNEIEENSQAIDYLDEALILALSEGDREMEALILINTANIYIKDGEYKNAIELLEQAITIIRSVGRYDIEATARLRFAIALDQLDRKSEAIEVLQVALNLLREKGLAHDISSTPIETYEAYLRRLESEVKVQSISKKDLRKLVKLYKLLGGSSIRLMLKSKGMADEYADTLIQRMDDLINSSVETTPDIAQNQSNIAEIFALKEYHLWKDNLSMLRKDHLNDLNVTQLIDSLIAVIDHREYNMSDNSPYIEFFEDAIVIIDIERMRRELETMKNEESTDKPNINVDGDVKGVNVNIGGTQTFHGNVKINYNALSSVPDGSPLNDLQSLLQELETALKQQPADKAEDVELTQEYANEIAEEATKESPRKKKLEITGENLKKAAENLLGVAPIVAKIAQKLLMLG